MYALTNTYSWDINKRLHSLSPCVWIEVILVFLWPGHLGGKKEISGCVLFMTFGPNPTPSPSTWWEFLFSFKKNTFTSINIVHITSQVQHVTCWLFETTPRHGQCTILLKTFSEIWEVMCWLKQVINKLWAVSLMWSFVKKYPVSAALFLSFIVRSRRQQNTKQSHS